MTLFSASVFAEVPKSQNVSTSSASEVKPQSLGDELENLGLLYRDQDNEVLQELWLLGRYHGQYYWADGSEADDHDYETRRMRVGLQSRLFKKLTLQAQMVSGSDVSPFYNGFTELWGQWAFSPEFALTVGQQKHRFTHDRNVSSRYLNYLERSMLTNMFSADYTPAITAQGKIENFNYYTGFFSNATGKNMQESFMELDSGYSYLATAYYDLKDIFQVDNTTVTTSYVYSDANQNATNLNYFDHGISAALIMTEGSGSLITELTGGIESENGNVFGINFQPGYFLTDKLQLVGRYQVALSNNEEGLNPQRRYEKEVAISSGDLYQAIYAGINYHIAEHRLKILNGIEYSTMNQEDVWTYSLMLRFYFGPHSGGAFPMNQLLPGAFEHD